MNWRSDDKNVRIQSLNVDFLTCDTCSTLLWSVYSKFLWKQASVYCEGMRGRQLPAWDPVTPLAASPASQASESAGTEGGGGGGITFSSSGDKHLILHHLTFSLSVESSQDATVTPSGQDFTKTSTGAGAVFFNNQTWRRWGVYGQLIRSSLKQEVKFP